MGAKEPNNSSTSQLLTDHLQPASEAEQIEEATPYEVRLSSDLRWAMNEGGLHFENASLVFKSLRNIARRLDDIGVSYAVIGGMALFHHGYRRYTNDVDIVIADDDLRLVHDKLEGHGYRQIFVHSKYLRDTQTGVSIKFRTSREYPGDGKPKPVKFGDHDHDIAKEDGVTYVGLVSLVNLKLASGMSNSSRLRDLADVQELVKVIELPEGFVDKLNPYVRAKFVELYDAAKADAESDMSPHRD